MRPIILGALCCFLLCSGCAHPYRKSSSTCEERWYTNRSDGLIFSRTRTESEGGGGTFLVYDAGANITAVHKNQTGMGGGSYLKAGSLDLKVDPQASEIIKSGGEAVGGVVGAALKTSVGIP